MTNTCCICGRLLGEGQRIQVLVTSTYHVLKSTIAYALDKADMEADSRSLCHVSCTQDEGYPDDV